MAIIPGLLERRYSPSYRDNFRLSHDLHYPNLPILELLIK